MNRKRALPLPSRARIRARVEQPDLAGAVRLLGWRGDTLEIMRSASVHCCPSLAEQREAFGIVVLEAKLTSLPSVVTPSGSVRSKDSKISRSIL